jgi:hypothetical protein
MAGKNDGGFDHSASARYVLLGVGFGIMLMFAGAVAIALLVERENPFGLKGASTTMQFALYVGVPVAVLLGGTAGFLLTRSRRTRNDVDDCETR